VLGRVFGVANAAPHALGLARHDARAPDDLALAIGDADPVPIGLWIEPPLRIEADAMPLEHKERRPLVRALAVSRAVAGAERDLPVLILEKDPAAIGEGLLALRRGLAWGVVWVRWAVACAPIAAGDEREGSQKERRERAV